MGGERMPSAGVVMGLPGVYVVKNTRTGREYVGQGVNLRSRWRYYSSKNAVNGKRPITKALNKYGIKNFIFTVICYCEVVDLNRIESQCTIKLNTLYPYGYNLKTGNGHGIPAHKRDGSRRSRFGKENGNFGNRWSAEKRTMFSKMMSGKGNPMYGRKNDGINGGPKRPKTQFEKMAVSRTLMKGQTVGCSNGKTYMGIFDAVEDTGAKKPNVIAVCRGRRKTTAGLSFWYQRAGN